MGTGSKVSAPKDREKLPGDFLCSEGKGAPRRPRRTPEHKALQCACACVEGLPHLLSRGPNDQRLEASPLGCRAESVMAQLSEPRRCGVLLALLSSLLLSGAEAADERAMASTVRPGRVSWGIVEVERPKARR